MEAIGIDIQDEIKSLCREFDLSFQKGDAAGIAALYTEDGMLLPAGSDIIKGKEAIKKYWQGAMDMGAKESNLHPIEVEQLEQTAIELGIYTLSGEGGVTLDKGKYMVVWKKENGSWKIQKDIWNSTPTV